MPKKPNTKVGSDIYAAAEKEAANLPSELHFKLDGVTLKRGRHQHCRSGAHRTKSIYGGYGHLCYKEFAYEHFSFTISFNSDFPTPHIEFVYKNKGHNEVSINVKLTENYWKSTNMMLEVQKAYHALTMDFEEVVEEKKELDDQMDLLAGELNSLRMLAVQENQSLLNSLRKKHSK